VFAGCEKKVLRWTLGAGGVDGGRLFFLESHPVCFDRAPHHKRIYQVSESLTLTPKPQQPPPQNHPCFCD